MITSDLSPTIKDSSSLPYPCYLRFCNEGFDYIVLAMEPSGPSFRGVIVKVFSDAGEDDDIYEGAIDDTFTMSGFGTPLGFNFYNEEVTTKNAVNYQ